MVYIQTLKVFIPVLLLPTLYYYLYSTKWWIGVLLLSLMALIGVFFTVRNKSMGNPEDKDQKSMEDLFLEGWLMSFVVFCVGLVAVRFIPIL